MPDLEYVLDRDHACEQALKDGLEIRFATDFVIQLDVDNSESMQRFEALLPKFLEFYPVNRIVRTPSRSGNDHFYVHLKEPLAVEARIALQAILGSDPVREILNLVRVHNDGRDPVLLFEKAGVVETQFHPQGE